MTYKQIELAANTIRLLAVDGVQKAKSGHPGLPMGAADFATVLFLKHLMHNPENPAWPNRDRFVLSAGHGSMLLYALLHLAGYDLNMDDLKQFRQLGSRTPGHPEHGMTPGVETSTGPLGQGCGNAVGMALAEAMQAARFNQGNARVVDHHTYCLCSDGDLMEGISHEAFSLAGHLGLNKLIVFYDNNKITIEGATSLSFSENIRKRFEGYNWNVLEVDGHDYAALDQVLTQARQSADRPTLIIGNTIIGKGSPKMAGTSEVHGAPLGEQEQKAVKRNLGFPEDETFSVPDEVRALFAARRKELKTVAKQWETGFQRYRQANPQLAQAWDDAASLKLPDNWQEILPVFDPAKAVATRNASHAVLQKVAAAVPYLVGGSADLSPSTRTTIEGAASVAARAFQGRNLHFGVREHAMGAIMNGMALHGGLRVYGATFFVFSDYFKPAIRLACIMKLPVIYVLTHDSFYVGEDGPTHEPIEQIMALRALPGMTVIRPADPTETAAAWVAALKNQQGPTAILLTRQNLPVLDRTLYPAASSLEQGAYVLWQNGSGQPDLIMLATGSEVSLALAAAQKLAQEEAVKVRVVNMPSCELFERQPESYKQTVLPPECVLRLSIEAGITLGWERYVGSRGRAFGLNQFGASAPYQALATEYGFTVENIACIARQMLAQK